MPKEIQHLELVIIAGTLKPTIGIMEAKTHTLLMLIITKHQEVTQVGTAPLNFGKMLTRMSLHMMEMEIRTHNPFLIGTKTPTSG